MSKIKKVRTIVNFRPERVRDMLKGYGWNRAILKLPYKGLYTDAEKYKFIRAIAVSRGMEIRYVLEIEFPELWVRK